MISFTLKSFNINHNLTAHLDIFKNLTTNSLLLTNDSFSYDLSLQLT